MSQRFGGRAPPSASHHEAFGVAFSLDCADPGLRARALDLLPPRTTRGDRRPAPPAVAAPHGHFTIAVTGPDRHQVALDGDRLLEHASEDVALSLLDAQIRLFVAARAPALVFVHAGVVGWRDRAIAIPGHSFSGKTTLVAALVGAGATYYSDEYAPLDADGQVHAYPRRLSIREPGAAAPATERQPSELGAVAAATAVSELGAIVVARYRPGGIWRPRVTTAGRGALALLANAVPARERPRQALAAVARAAHATVVLEGDRGEAQPAAAAILAGLDRHWA